MSFFAGVILWASMLASLPIAIALWSRFRPKREEFGGFYLLRQLMETQKRRIRLLELIKLLNRIALFILLVLFFADPLKKVDRIGEAANGFAILLDMGRSMQATAERGSIKLADFQQSKLRELLEQIPSQSRGVLLGFSQRCEGIALDGKNLFTARPSDWIDALDDLKLPYTNLPTTTQGFTECFGRIQSIFDKKEVFKAVLSPLPNTLSIEALQNMKVRHEFIPAPDVISLEEPTFSQELSGDKVSVSISPLKTRRAELIHRESVEQLGSVQAQLDLLAEDQTWLHLFDDEILHDPWAGHQIIPIRKQLTHRVNLWAQKETPGYLSLLAALRSHVDLKVQRQIGGEPSGDPLIIYGPYSGSLEPFARSRVWFFVDPEGASPFKLRDKKQWASGAQSRDAIRAFQLHTRDGEILIRKYALFDLDEFDTVESFEDGAPALLKSRLSRSVLWVSPFDLEDLTTDLSLEPTFIPYLYRRLDRWLEEGGDVQIDGTISQNSWTPIWLMKGSTPAAESVVIRREWPGIYLSGARSIIVPPVRLPETYQKYSDPKESVVAMASEEISTRESFIPWLVFSMLLEILLCLFSIRELWLKRAAWTGAFLLFALSPSVHAQIAQRNIPIGIWPDMDVDRKESLQQFVGDSIQLSNLEFSKPQAVKVSQLWKYAVVVESKAGTWGPFSKEDRELIRDYCERGGLLLFDDPLAVGESQFYKSVQSELRAIFPGRELKSVSKEDVLFRTFYLLNEVSGRKLASPNLEGLEFDKRWVAIFSFNDLLGALLRTPTRDFALPVSPYGISQRNLAKRLLLNLLMYSVSLNYKDDSIHLPHILKRRVR